MALFKGKTKIILATCLSLFAVLVGGISTAAWFQLDSQLLQANLTTATPGIEIDESNVYGYKVKQTLDDNGEVDYTSDTVSKFAGGSIVGTNNDLDGEDTEFNIPTEGIGFYLVKYHDGGFKYDNSNTFKLNEYSATSRTFYADISFAAGQTVRIMEYNFDNTGGVHTVNRQVAITNVDAGSSGAIREKSDATNYTGDVTIENEGTYTVWFHASDSRLIFETKERTTDHRASRIGGPSIKKAATTTKGSNFGYLYLNCHGYSWPNDGATVWLNIYNASNGTQLKMAVYSGSGGTTIYRVSLTGLSFTPTGLGFVRINGSTFNWSNKWNEAANISFNSSYNTYHLTSWDSGQCSNSVTNSSTAYEKYADGFYYYKTVNSEGSDWDDGNFTFLKANLPTDSVTLSFAKDEYFKVIELNNYRRLWNFASFSGTKNWMNPEGKITASGSAVTSTGNEGNCQAQWAFTCTFVFNASYQYVFTLASYTVEYKYYDLSNSVIVSGTASTSTSLYNGQTLTFPTVPSAPSGYTRYEAKWHDGTTTGSTGYAGNATTTISSNKTYYLLLYKTYSVTFAYWDVSANQSVAGTPATAKTINQGSTFSFPAIPGSLPAGYRLYNYESVWHATTATSSTSYAYNATSPSVTGNITYYILLSPLSQYTLTYKQVLFDHNGTKGTVSTINSVTQYENVAFTITSLPSVTGRTVTGWYTNENCTEGQGSYAVSSSYLLTGNLTLYAKCIENSITITKTKVLWNEGASTVASTSSLGTETWYSCTSNSLSAPAATAGYEFLGWRESSTGSVNVTFPKTYTASITLYAIFQPIPYNVTYHQAFFNHDGTTTGAKATTTLAPTATAYGSSAYAASYSPTDPVEHIVAGSWTHYVWDGHYYTNEACSSEYSSSKPTAGFSLYLKYVSVGQKTFHIDTRKAGWNSAVYAHGWGTGFTSGDNATDIQCEKIGDYLYRVSIPFTVNGILFDTGSYTSGNQTTNVTTINDGGLLYVDSTVTYEDGKNKKNWFWDSVKTPSSIGTAKIYVDGVEAATMHYGDIDNYNNFVYEHGLDVTNGSSIEVRVTNNEGTTVLNAGSYIGSLPSYLTADGSTLRVSASAKYNFYVTHTGQLSVTMVPSLGNGYYIMPYASTTANFLGAKKMSTGSKTHAVYDGYYAAANSQIFIRSYIDAVDTIYETLSGSSASGVSMSSGIITITNAGYYSISVTNGVVDIQTYDTSEEFKLNPLNTSNVSTASAIHGQKTSLIIEVPFTYTGNYPSSLQLVSSFNGLSFIGASLYVSAVELGTSCYNVVRGANSPSSTYSALSNSSIITNTSAVSLSGTDRTYYAYILIDYLPNVSYTGFTTPANLAKSISFILQAVQ